MSNVIRIKSTKNDKFLTDIGYNYDVKVITNECYCGVGRYTKTLKEARVFARGFNATIEEEL